MSSESADPRPSQGSSDSRREALELLIGEYIDRLNSGESLDPERIRAEHPELAEDLLRELEAFQDLDLSWEPHGDLGTLGDYTLRRRIGRGGMGVVYEAWESSMDRAVALKVLPAAVAADNRAFVRFMREAKTAGQLNHPNIVCVHGLGLKEQTPYYSMELVSGETLARILGRLREAGPETETPFGPKDEMDYFVKLARSFAGVADGLQHAHSRGVIHRDIKPSNLILDTEIRLRILDFGLARLEGQESLTQSGDFVGTPLYVSPEQAQRRKVKVDHRTDIYSLGATLYEMLTGRPPHRGKDHQDTLSQIIEREPVEPRGLNPRIPGDLETIVLKCLRKEPADRYGTAEAAAQDLRRFVRGDPIEARPQGRWEKLARRARRNAGKILATAVVLLLGGLAAWFGYDSYRDQRALELLEYRAAVLDAVIRLDSARFILGNVPGSEQPTSRMPLGLLSLRALTRDDWQQILERGGIQPVTEAARELEALAASLPGERDAHYHLARAYLLLGRSDAAEERLRKALEIDPRFVPAEMLLLNIRGEGATSTESPDDESESSPPSASAVWRELWLATRRRGWNEVVASYDRLLAVSQDGHEPYIGFFIEAYMKRGAAYLELGRPVDALQDFAVVRYLAPRSLEVDLPSAKAYLMDGNKERARSLFQGLLDRSARARDVSALWVSANCISFEELTEALDWAAAIRRPSLRERLMASIHLLRKDWEGAVAAGRRAVEADGRDLTAYYLLGKALDGLLSDVRSADAERILELLRTAHKAVQLAPDDPRSRRCSWAALGASKRFLHFARKKEAMSIRKKTIEEITALMLALGGGSAAWSQMICDDFLDGDPWNGPVYWMEGYPGGVYTIVDGCLEMEFPTSSDASLVHTQWIEGDVSIHIQGSFNGTDRSGERPSGHKIPPRISAVLHADRDADNFDMYYGVVNVNGMLYLQKWVAGDKVRDERRLLGFDPWKDPDGQLVNLEIELTACERPVGEMVLELRVWKRGEERPATPQVTIVDSEDPHTSGYSGFAGWQEGSGAIPDNPPLRIGSVCIDQDPCASPPPDSEFIRGDPNGDGKTDLSDAVSTLDFLFLGGPASACEDSADADDTGGVELTDAVYLLNYLFLGGPAPASPFPDCGLDPSADDPLTCEAYPPCAE